MYLNPSFDLTQYKSFGVMDMLVEGGVHPGQVANLSQCHTIPPTYTPIETLQSNQLTYKTYFNTYLIMLMIKIRKL